MSASCKVCVASIWSISRRCNHRDHYTQCLLARYCLWTRCQHQVHARQVIVWLDEDAAVHSAVWGQHAHSVREPRWSPLDTVVSKTAQWEAENLLQFPDTAHVILHHVWWIKKTPTTPSRVYMRLFRYLPSFFFACSVPLSPSLRLCFAIFSSIIHASIRTTGPLLFPLHRTAPFLPLSFFSFLPSRPFFLVLVCTFVRVVPGPVPRIVPLWPTPHVPLRLMMEELIRKKV